MVRLTLALTSLLAPAFLLAQDAANSLGTKADLITSEPVKPTSPNLGVAQFVPMLVALGIIFFLLKYALPKVVGKFNKRLTTPLSSPITLEESASFATGSLQVVTVRGKSMLLAITQQGVTFLSEVPDSAPIDPTPAFFELLDRESEEPKPQKLITHAVVEEPAEKSVANPAVKAYQSQTKKAAAPKTESASRDELLDRLAKLQKLTKN